MIVLESQTITCYLADDSSISINRSQVEIIPNFAMTDYCSQGKTRPINPVDLTNCQSHQSYYTTLSRSTSTEGTVLLPDFTDPKLFMFDLRKIQGGCLGHLRQEFHKLELLDHITLLQYEGNIPMSVYGERQYDLIERFQIVAGASFIPPQIERLLRWSVIDPFQPIECSKFEWDIKPFTHAPTGIIQFPKNKQGENKENKSTSCKHTGLSDTGREHFEVQTTMRKVTSMKVPGKRKGRTSDEGVTDTSDQNVRVLRPVQPIHPNQVVAGCVWSNNSCPYDSVMFVLANIWKRDPTIYLARFADINTEWMGTLADAMEVHNKAQYSLEQVRDFMRRKLHRAFPTVFVYGRESSPCAIMERWFKRDTPVSIISNMCGRGHKVDDIVSVSLICLVSGYL